MAKTSKTSRGKTTSRRSTKASRSGSTSHATTDHQEIRRWVEQRGGTPACVKGTGGRGDAGVLRIDFPGYSGEDSLQPMDWDEWFEKFDRENLALLLQERTRGGGESRFAKLIQRGTAGKRRSSSAKSSPRRSARRAGASKRTAKRASTRSSGRKTSASSGRKTSASSGRKTTASRARHGRSAR
jgi:hypothetical protein